MRTILFSIQRWTYKLCGDSAVFMVSRWHQPLSENMLGKCLSGEAVNLIYNPSYNNNNQLSSTQIIIMCVLHCFQICFWISKYSASFWYKLWITMLRGKQRSRQVVVLAVVVEHSSVTSSSSFYDNEAFWALSIFTLIVIFCFILISGVFLLIEWSRPFLNLKVTLDEKKDCKASLLYLNGLCFHLLLRNSNIN